MEDDAQNKKTYNFAYEILVCQKKKTSIDRMYLFCETIFYANKNYF